MDGLDFSVEMCVIQLPCNVREKVEGEVGGGEEKTGIEESRRGREGRCLSWAEAGHSGWGRVKKCVLAGLRCTVS